MLDQAARAFHVQAVEPTEVAVLSAAGFWDVVNRDPRALPAVTRLVCAKYRASLAWIEEASLKPRPARLAARLVALAGEQTRPASGVRLAQDGLASQLGWPGRR